ncbi:MAG: hypothetical protein ACYCW6_11675, partial [Candidatus Xenobia bacterium]
MKELKHEPRVAADLTYEALGASVIFRWPPEVHQKLNYADQDLWLVVREAESHAAIAEDKVSNLALKDVQVGYDRDVEAMLLEKDRPRVTVSTSMNTVPRVVIVAENPQRHHVSWGDLDWASVHREVGRVHQISMERDCEVVLDVTRWPGDLPQHERMYPGMKDYALVVGPIQRLDLAVVRRVDQAPLKTLFSLSMEAQAVQDVLAHVRFRTAPKPHQLVLAREVREENVVEVRARW